MHQIQWRLLLIAVSLSTTGQTGVIGQALAASKLELAGQAIHSELQLDYYYATLHTAPLSASDAPITDQATTPAITAIADEPVPDDPLARLTSSTRHRMQLTVLVDEWSKRRFVEHWNQAILINNSESERKRLAADIVNFRRSIKGNLQRADVFTIGYDKASGVEVALNGVPLMKTRRAGFYTAFVNTWIGSRPPSSVFKAAITANLFSSSNADELPNDSAVADYIALTPSNKRIRAIKRWVHSPATSKRNPSIPIAVTSPTPAPSAKKPSTPVTPVDHENTAPPESLAAKKIAPPTRQQAAPAAKTEAELSADLSIEAVNIDTDAVAKATETETETETDNSMAGEKVATPPIDKPNEPADGGSLNPPDVDSAQEIIVSDPAIETPLMSGSDTANESANANEQLLNVYRSNILALTYQNLIYPTRAIDRGQEGNVVLKWSVSRKGTVKDVSFEKNSAHALLDRAASKAVEKASPYPDVPRKLKGSNFEITLPIKFKLSS